MGWVIAPSCDILYTAEAISVAISHTSSFVISAILIALYY